MSLSTFVKDEENMIVDGSVSLSTFVKDVIVDVVQCPCLFL